jgi:Protein of unknown function (DUF3995)
MIRNVHERLINASPERVGQLLDSLAGDNDMVWPRDAWPRMKLSNGLAVGSTGGHGAIRYSVESYTPGRKVVFRFADKMGIVGTHTFAIEPVGTITTMVTHELIGTTTGAMKLVWPLFIRWLHDALIEDALDNIESASSKTPRPTRTYSFGVRQLRSIARPSPATDSPAIRWGGTATALGLASAGAIHAAWGLGMSWPGTDATSLARKVVGSSIFPSSRDCFAVAGLLGIAASLVAARTRPKSIIAKIAPNPIAGLGVGVLGSVLAARGVLGFVGSATNLLHTTSEFRRLNLVIYSPLCIALAAGAFAVNGNKLFDN